MDVLTTEIRDLFISGQEPSAHVRHYDLGSILLAQAASDAMVQTAVQADGRRATLAGMREVGGHCDALMLDIDHKSEDLARLARFLKAKAAIQEYGCGFYLTKNGFRLVFLLNARETQVYST